MKKYSQFNSDYFQTGPYKGAKIEGITRYFGKYYWARRFYARLIRDITHPNGKILEIGCGFGDLLSFLENDFSTIGTDVSEDAIKEAKKRLNRTRLAVLKAEHIGGLGKNSFDTIIASHILEHLKSPQVVIKSAVKLLKKGGIFFVVVPNTDSIGRKLKGEGWIGFRDKTHISLYSPVQWRELLIREKFHINKTFGDGLWDSPYLPYIPKLIQQIIFGIPSAFQAFWGIPFIPPYFGESIVIMAQKQV